MYNRYGMKQKALFKFMILAWNTLLWINLKFTLSFYRFSLILWSCTWQFISQPERKIFSEVVNRDKYMVIGWMNIFLYKKSILNRIRRKCFSDVHILNLITFVTFLNIQHKLLSFNFSLLIKWGLWKVLENGNIL